MASNALLFDSLKELLKNLSTENIIYIDLKHKRGVAKSKWILSSSLLCPSSKAGGVVW